MVVVSSQTTKTVWYNIQTKGLNYIVRIAAGPLHELKKQRANDKTNKRKNDILRAATASKKTKARHECTETRGFNASGTVFAPRALGSMFESGDLYSARTHVRLPSAKQTVLKAADATAGAAQGQVATQELMSLPGPTVASRVHEPRLAVPQVSCVGYSGRPAQVSSLGQVDRMSRASNIRRVAAARLASSKGRIQPDAPRMLARQLGHDPFTATGSAGSRFGSLHGSTVLDPCLSGAQSPAAVAPVTMPQQPTSLLARARLAALLAGNLGIPVAAPARGATSLGDALAQGFAAAGPPPTPPPQMHSAHTPAQNDAALKPQALTVPAANMAPTSRSQAYPAQIRSTDSGNPVPDPAAARREDGTDRHMSQSDWDDFSKGVNDLFGKPVSWDD